MRLVAFRKSYIEFDVGTRLLLRIGYPRHFDLNISDDCQRITMVENGFVAILQREYVMH